MVGGRQRREGERGQHDIRAPSIHAFTDHRRLDMTTACCLAVPKHVPHSRRPCAATTLCCSSASRRWPRKRWRPGQSRSSCG